MSQVQTAGAAARHTVVIGLQFGDEGKGQVVDRLSGEHDVIVRYNGGANAGHSVQVGEERFALHLVPSGIVRGDTLNLIANGVALDPYVLLDEIDTLCAKGVPVGENLKLSDRAHLVLPWHRAEEALLEAAAGEAAIGTTKRGIGPCYADKALRSTAVRAGELLDPAGLRPRLEWIAGLKNAMLGGLAAALDQPFEPLDAAAIAAELSAAGERLRPHLCDMYPVMQEALAAHRVLFEGAHATMLDIDHGTYPFVTSSNATALGLHAGAGVPAKAIGYVCGVMKTYMSRVGAGPFETELDGALANELRERGREYGTTTGRPRRVGWLNLPQARYAARLNGVDGLVLTGLGVLAGLGELKAWDGERLLALEPIPAGIEGCRAYDEMPGAVGDYVALIEEHVAPVAAVCVGRGREQMIERLALRA